MSHPMGVMSHPNGGVLFKHLWMRVHTYTLGCAIWTTLMGVRLHPLGLQCRYRIKSTGYGAGLATRWLRVRFPAASAVLGWVNVLGQANQLSISPSTQANSASYPQRMVNEYQPKCGDVLRLGRKGRYGSFHLWTNVWVAGKTV